MNYSIKEIADKINGTINPATADQIIHSLKPIRTATNNDLTYFDPNQNNITTQDLKQTQAGVVITTAQFQSLCPHATIVVDQPRQAFAIIAHLFEHTPAVKQGIHASVVMGDNCQIDETACIGPNVVIGNNTTIGAHTMIQANTVIGDEVHIGQHNQIFANVTIYSQTRIANHVIIHSGAVIGADGFGFVPNKEGQWQRVPQIGGVCIADHVSIGAGCTIDCGALEDTIIEQGVKIDDQVHIAHNVKVGAHSIIAGYSAIAGSVTIGKHCMLAGGIRVSDNLTITDKVILTAGSAAVRDIKEADVYSSGIPVMPAKKWRRVLARLGKLDDLAKTVKGLEKKLYD